MLGPATLQAADPSAPPTTNQGMFREATGGEVTASAVQPLVLPAGFHESVAFGGLVSPTAMAFAADGRVFVAEKRGTIKVFDSLDDPTPTTYADLRTNVYDFWDRGLLGIALDPNFTTNGNLFALYTYNHVLADAAPAPKWTGPSGNDICPTPPGSTTDGCLASARLSRLHAGGGGLWDGTENVLIEDWCQVHPSHSIGTVAFGPDGALYVGAGDAAWFNGADYGQDRSADDTTPDNPCGDPPTPGVAPTPPNAEGGALRSQDLRTPGDPVTLDGAILRLDPATGLAMAGNPLIGSADLNARRIIADGLRNPFRFTFRPGTNELWIGDVGMNTWEEVNRLVSPTAPVTDFGWPCYEGAGRQPLYDSANLSICENLYSDATTPAVGPFYTYDHGAHVVSGDACPTDSGSVISGTAFYPTGGGPFPSSFNGGFFFGDYARNCIWFMPAGGGGLPNAAAVQVFASGVAGPVELKIGPDGALYYASLNTGTIRRISRGPVAVATANPTSATAGVPVQFDGSGSNDPQGGGGPIAYAWDLDGDGQFDDSSAASPTWTYNAGGSVIAQLKVTDANGSDIARVTVSVDTPPVASISSPSSNLTWSVGDTITFGGSATDAEDGTEPAGRLSWTIFIKHCPSACHDHILQTLAGAGGTFGAPDHEYPSELDIKLVATDAFGVASAPVTVVLQPKTVNLAFASSPSGISLTIGNLSRAAPFNDIEIAGAIVGISAPASVVVGGRRLYFKGWSDGLPASHAVTARLGAPTLIATYGLRPRVTRALVPAPRPRPVTRR